MQTTVKRLVAGAFAFFYLAIPLAAQIRIPNDAPQPMAPAESAASVSLPDGFSLELIASEPLIRNPSGVCWDHRGRMFVCELHGYNMEGQYDIEELNQTGKLDREVRRIPAPPTAIARAERDQTGAVKRLVDRDGDGIMDEAEVWANDLPACFGIVPAREGVIVICAPDIVYLADKDDDGQAETREVLLTGFRTGVLERRMSAPQWGPDNWIYVAGGGGTITGPQLNGPVELPRNDFRFKPDGSAIEPLPAGTWTFGFTFSGSGDRYVISTGTPAIYEAPLPWRYLQRNPHVAFGTMTKDVSPSNRCYPISQPHPWRTQRASDAGFEEFYRSRYGAAESTPNGFFTSACSPLIYKDSALPLAGQLLACEPAQNLIHRGYLVRDGLIPQLQRHRSEAVSEFLASADIWFHPIALSHAPDGAIVICDFYREIIEDYSAIPRYLQQLYQLKHGEYHGRLWKLVHRDMPSAKLADMSQLSPAALVTELQSSRFWRRQTARRLLIEQDHEDSSALLEELITKPVSGDAMLAALEVLKAAEKLKLQSLAVALEHSEVAVIVQALRLLDEHPDRGQMLGQLQSLVDHDERVVLQLALSLGQFEGPLVRQWLAQLAVESPDTPWMDDAILSSLNRGGVEVLQLIMARDGEPPLPEATLKFAARLSRMIADQRNDADLSGLLVSILDNHDTRTQQACLAGLRQAFASSRPVALSAAARAALLSARRHADPQIAEAARFLVVAMQAETRGERAKRLEEAATQITDIRHSVETRLEAVAELSAESGSEVVELLITSFHQGTPAIRAKILEVVFARKENGRHIIEALESHSLSFQALSAVQREILLTNEDDDLAARARRLLTDSRRPEERLEAQYIAALAGKRDKRNGQRQFKRLCSNCHRVGEVGYVVGPNLKSEFARDETTFLQDILAPRAKITPGYELYIVHTVDDRILSGVLVAESPTSITLRKEEGREQTVLRKDILGVRVSAASLMPDDLVKTVEPSDLADIIAWLRG